MTKRYSLCTFKDKHGETQAFMKEEDEGTFVKFADYAKALRWRKWPEEKPTDAGEYLVERQWRSEIDRGDRHSIMSVNFWNGCCWTDMPKQDVKNIVRWLLIPGLEER